MTANSTVDGIEQGMLLREVKDGIAVLTINRPECRNALSGALADQLRDSLAGLERDASVRAVIITGAGSQAFCSGTDLKDPQRVDPEYRAVQRQKAWGLNQALWSMGKPTVAAVHGWCLGGGFELAISCDFRVAASDAVFAFPELALGAFPGAGAPIRLPQIVGMTMAKDLLYSGRRVGADEALSIGLISKVSVPNETQDCAIALAQQVATGAPLAIAAIKQLLEEGGRLSYEAAATLSDSLHRRVAASSDSEEGLRASNEKRLPIFQGK